MTQDYINPNEAYLERLMQMRQREKEHLSDVDFSLFVKRFDRLITKIETDLKLAKSVDRWSTKRALLSSTADCCGSIVLGANLSAHNYKMVLTHYGCDPVSSFRETRIHPSKVSLNTISTRNDRATAGCMNLAFAMPV